jgi:hypothetical protein
MKEVSKSNQDAVLKEKRKSYPVQTGRKSPQPPAKRAPSPSAFKSPSRSGFTSPKFGRKSPRSQVTKHNHNIKYEVKLITFCRPFLLRSISMILVLLRYHWEQVLLKSPLKHRRNLKLKTSKSLCGEFVM